MKCVKVDKEKCIGCGACMSIAPNTFEFGDDGLSQVKTEFVEDDTAEVENAKDCCPTGAISVEDAEEKED